MLKAAAVVGLAGAGANGARAQFVPYDGNPYTQNFDSLTNTAEGIYPAPLNDLTAAPPAAPGLTGWYGSKTGGNGSMVYVYNDGTDTRLGLLGSFGVTGVGDVTDRALGSNSSGTTSINRFGVLIKNTTATTFTRIDLSFDVEQWRRNDQNNFAGNTTSYAVGGDGLTIDGAGFTGVGALEWNTLVRADNGRALDGNDAAHRAQRAVSNLSIGAWAPGQVLAIRFDDGNDGGGDDIVAIDNFAFSAAGVAGKNLTWSAPAGGVWDTDAANRPWLEGATPSAFANTDIVTFGPSAANVPVTVDAGGVEPSLANVTNDNAAGGYTFTGGAIRGILNKSGAGRLVLANANELEQLRVTGGTLETPAGAAFGAATTVSLADATWRATGAQDVAGNNNVRVAGNVTIEDTVGLLLPGFVSGTSGGTLTIKGTGPAPTVMDAGGYNGNVVLQSGTIRSATGAADGDLFSDATVLTLEAGTKLEMDGNGDSFGGLQGAGAVDVGNAVGSFINLRGGGDRTFAGTIAGTTSNAASNGLTQEGGGVLTLTGKSTFVAPTSVRNGTIVLGGNVLIGQDGPLGNSDQRIRIGTTTLVNSTAGLLFNGPFAIDRPISVSSSTNAVVITLGANADVNAEFRSDIDYGKSSRLTSVSTGTNAVTFSGAILLPGAGTLHTVTKIGSGLVVLSSPNNSYIGSTTVNEGTLRVTGSIATSAGVVVNNAGAFEARATQTVQALAVNQTGVARVTRGAGAGPTVLTVGGPNVVAGTSPVTLQTDGTNTGRIDLTNNGLVIDFAAGDEAAAIQIMRAEVTRGYNGGNWAGAGVASSVAAGDSSKAVGFALASEVLTAAAPEFMGVAGIDDSSVLARFTLAGDATLDGQVDFNDLVRLAQNYDTTLAGDSTWVRGDFTYDGVVDFNDLVKLAQNYDTALPAGPVPGAPAGFDGAVAAAFAAVPEPSSALVALAAGGLAGAGRRRRR
jgi:autotransporter-associated beta strand protein